MSGNFTKTEIVLQILNEYDFKIQYHTKTLFTNKKKNKTKQKIMLIQKLLISFAHRNAQL